MVKALVEVRDALANMKTSESPTTFNGTPPESMSFGPSNGVGAGFYDSVGNIYRCCVGTTYWAVVEEVAPEKPSPHARFSRDGEKYFTPLELVQNYVPATYLRSSSKALVNYYANGTMIVAHKLLEGTMVVIPQRLLAAHIWFKIEGYLRFVNHTAIVGFAFPTRAPTLDGRSPGRE